MSALLLFVMLTACAASPQDLSGKMFTFPQETKTANVMLNISTHRLNAVTVCLRSFTDLRRAHSLFSLATPSSNNGFLMETVTDRIDFHVNNLKVQYVVGYKLNTWHSVCSTWDADSGLGQLWFNGQPLARKFLSKSQISEPIVVLGQEQDSYAGSFDTKQSFTGMMADVHMWNYILSPCEIQNYVDNLNFTPGNVLNWKALTFDVTGRVLIEDRQMTCH
ncbi:serum amyloid P-component-like [Fundulus heteroclitus]|uniref:serum amyloid P-component-like n=1 Tax=Fundulus heteroclitus TaxID=8078 RepID=UPI00165A964B|nr:serum amyloid P-component-like [Fundulus heteroclitus]